MTQLDTRPVARTAGKQWSDADVGNIIALEHVNTTIPDQTPATLFYIVGLGFTRDPYMNVGLENMWANIGEQQIHMPTRGAQRLPGHVGIVVPSLQSLVGRLESVKDALAGTQFSFAVKDGYVEAVSPWGNVFRAYEPDPRFGDMKIGIPYVDVNVRRGAAEGIVRFYDQVMGAPASLTEEDSGKVARIRIGTYQELIFRETDEDIPPYDKHHIAVYIADFSGPLNWLRERNLVTEEPRNHQFRFEAIVDPATGEQLHTLEHEVRGLFHKMYQRPMANRNADQRMAAYVRGADILQPFGP
jgi:hypothetical protein